MSDPEYRLLPPEEMDALDQIPVSFTALDAFMITSSMSAALAAMAHAVATLQHLVVDEKKASHESISTVINWLDVAVERSQLTSDLFARKLNGNG